MKRNFQIFWIKFKKFIENPFYWNVAAALTSMALADCFIWQGQNYLALVWMLSGICQIAMAYMNKEFR